VNTPRAVCSGGSAGVMYVKQRPSGLWEAWGRNSPVRSFDTLTEAEDYCRRICVRSMPYFRDRA
jgi:hypothetical protein